MPDRVHILGRLAIDRSIRFRSGLVEPAAVDPLPERSASCARCGAPLCEASRAHLFTGMRLRCAACGESTRLGG